MKQCALYIVLTAVLVLAGCSEGLVTSRQLSRHLLHDVYFALNDNSTTAQAKLVKDCYTYLSHHPGVVFFAAGPRVESHAREVNVRDWDVSLHIVFKSKEYHDQYQNAPNHHKFIEENRENWKGVRVFDSYIK